MNRRAITLFKILAREDDYVSAEALCNEIGIKPRTLREDIKNHRSIIENNAGARIENKPNLGYRLVIHNDHKFYQFLQIMMNQEANAQFLMPVQQDDRVHYLIRLFLSTNDYLKIDDLAASLYVSRSTLTSDIKVVKENLDFQNISLESKVGRGLRIKGKEADIRSTMSLYFFHSKNFDEEQIQMNNMDFFNDQSKALISELLYRNIILYHFKLTDFGFQNLVIHILISVYRIKDETYVEDKSLKFDDLVTKNEWNIAMAIAAEIGTAFDIHLPQAEIAYITVHLLGKKVLGEDDDTIVTTTTLNLVNEIFKQVESKFNYTFNNDIELFTMLSLHIQPMINRMKYGIKLHNPMLEEIKEENPFAFEMSVLAGKIISKKIEVRMPESELGYLTLHFALALQRNAKQEKNRVLIVCASGAGTSQILLYKVKNELKDLINEAKVVNAFQLEKIDQSEYDLILSTIPILEMATIPVIQVEYTLGESDLSRVIEHLTKDKSEMNEIKSWFNKRLVSHRKSVSSQEDLIKDMCTDLGKILELPKDFYDMVIEREHITSTFIGNGIAIPHPAQLVTDKTAISMCFLDEPVMWGVNKVELVFLLAIKKDESNLLVIFNKLMGTLLNDNAMVAALKENPTYENLMQQVSSLFILESDLEDDFFA